MIEVPSAFAKRRFVCAARDACPDVPSRGRCLVPSRRDLPGALIPGKIDAASRDADAAGPKKAAQRLAENSLGIHLT
jgi:hypothetical protein